MRMDMQKNADQLMQAERAQSYKRAMCEPCFAFTEDGTMLPEQTKVSCNKQFCTVSANKPGGLGQGRDYGNRPATTMSYYPIEGITTETYDKFAAF
jgi:hypothetical protein